MYRNKPLQDYKNLSISRKVFYKRFAPDAVKQLKAKMKVHFNNATLNIHMPAPEIKPTLICQDCGWEGHGSECHIFEDEHDQEISFCPNCWNESFFEIEEDCHARI